MLLIQKFAAPIIYILLVRACETRPTGADRGKSLCFCYTSCSTHVINFRSPHARANRYASRKSRYRAMVASRHHRVAFSRTRRGLACRKTLARPRLRLNYGHCRRLDRLSDRWLDFYATQNRRRCGRISLLPCCCDARCRRSCSHRASLRRRFKILISTASRLAFPGCRGHDASTVILFSCTYWS